MPIYLLVLSIGLAIWTVYRAILLLDLISKIEKARGWETVKGIVKDARLLVNKEKKRAVIHFYAEYEHKNISFGTTKFSLYSKTKSIEKIMIKKIKTGSEIDIYINPKNPHISIALNPNSHSYMSEWLMMMFGIFFTLITIYLGT